MSPTTALVYLARGAESDHLDRFARFIDSYGRVESGHPHMLYVIYKGYRNDAALGIARRRFAVFDHVPLFLKDDSFDIGAYAEVASVLTEDTVCFLNSNVEITTDRWLGKLKAGLDLAGVGIVGASGSFESLGHSRNAYFRPAPNVHLRSNVFMMRRALAVEILGSFRIASKIDAFMAESGADSVTRQVLRRGLSVLVIGKDGRALSPPFWPASRGFRSEDQSNLLVEDNLSREFAGMPPSGRQEARRSSWGRYEDSACLLRFP